MMRSILFLSCLIGLILSCDTKKDFPDPAENYFIRYYGKEGNHEGVDVVANTDGTFIICGNSKIIVSESNQLDYKGQIYLAKADTKGMILWEKSLGKFTDEVVRDIELTSDGNIVLVGEVNVAPGNDDIVLMTLNQDGAKIDSVVFGVTPGLDDEAVSVTELSDGFIVCGSKLNPPSLTAGDLRDAIQVRFTKSLGLYPNWRNSYNQGTVDVAIKAMPRSITNTLIFGYTNGITANDPNRSFNYWVYDLNLGGEPGASQNRLGSPVENEFAGSAILSPPILGEGYLISGISIDNNGSNNLFVVKHALQPLFLQNDVQFERKFEDNLGNIPGNRVFSCPSAGVGFLLLTNQLSANNDKNLYLLKIDSRGQRLWNAPVILGGEGDDDAGAIAELPDGRILVCGTITLGGTTGQKKIAIFKLNSSGRLED